jgi:transcriptional regulator with XRE-family HTH domain
VALDLHRWRTRGGFTQAEAAQALGVSQTYLSLIERGLRPVTEAVTQRLKTLRPHAPRGQAALDGEFRTDLAALRYPPFDHLGAPRHRANPATVLLRSLRQPDVDARVAEGLPWVASHYYAAIDWAHLTRQAKLNNFQNRLGFLLDLALPVLECRAQLDAAAFSAMRRARSELEEARLLREATFCWDSMPRNMRLWIRANRSPSAENWNILTRLRSEDLPYE